MPTTVILKATLAFAVCIQHVCKNLNMSNHLFGIIVCSDIFVELDLFSFVRSFVTFGSSEMELKWERHQYLRNVLAEKNTHNVISSLFGGNTMTKWENLGTIFSGLNAF